jgi:hypothetical protein
MALTRVKTWIADEELTASTLNAEFDNIINNAVSLISPVTSALDLDGNQLILDSDADTHLTADTDDRIDIALSGTDLFRFDGTATTPVNGITFIAGAAGVKPRVQAFGIGADTGIDLRDVNGNEIAILDPVASAVNELTVKNAATGNSPEIQATGGDADIDLKLVPKGTGQIDVGTGGATQAEMETGTATTHVVTPGVQLHHPAHPKGWVKATVAAAITAHYNVSSITDNAAANFTINWTTAFSSADYAISASVLNDGATALRLAVPFAQAAGTVQLLMGHHDATATGVLVVAEANITHVYAIACGDQ